MIRLQLFYFLLLFNWNIRKYLNSQPDHTNTTSKFSLKIQIIMASLFFHVTQPAHAHRCDVDNSSIFCAKHRRKRSRSALTMTRRRTVVPDTRPHQRSNLPSARRDWDLPPKVKGVTGQKWPNSRPCSGLWRPTELRGQYWLRKN